ncbi:LysR family transcriptional regulator [Saccharopolyspora elongata]|uniref:LysR family transcriptional regulator n=1 Tax=Saccharopolyspora elongata TaxID=2530387 RepID=A0A4V2YJI9_9PSEU|nr:LysR substrate-binding domain-containing protein [Saccharopolyspora elongata]TDD39097.1 LysR family transcriptional regulator [Saccharopolyspora elongata]
MEIRQLRYVVRLAETLHFGRAAQLEHIAQSAFSGHIAKLERDLDVKLFDRSHHRVALTPAGVAFVERAEEILAQVAGAAAEAKSLAPRHEEVLRVGIFAEGAGELTPVILSVYRELQPDVRLEFTELSMVDQLEKLVSNEVDVAFVRAPFDDERISLRPIFSEPRVAAVPHHHPLADAGEISVTDLLDEPFAAAGTGAPAGWSSYWSCDDHRGARGRVATHVRSIGECLMAISCLGAVDTFPQTAARLFHHAGVSYVPVPDAAPSTVTAAMRNNDLRPHVRAFDRAVQHAVRNHLDLVPNAAFAPAA